ncbi:hypothetical protein [Desulfitobacterium sp.]|uniref:hypothetical protein n=1 Tax=Desulfitobacterium sp. TaxID=49981 RepID=UPI002B21052F|nr:hypothetical protein [Desulfitobacterium sp.]MEA4902573.1 hypothetical protein [Desulfitobacterium sp.]
MFLPSKNVDTNISMGQAATEVTAATEGTLGTNIFMAAALLIMGQMVGRYLFYAMMMISTVGLN